MADEILNIAVKVNQAIRSDKIRATALTTTLAIQKPRIFVKGEAEDGSKIGSYSPVYAKYKSAKGKNPGYVNFQDTDQMMNDYGVIISGEQYAFGFQNSFNAQKSVWLSEKYGKQPFHVSTKEVEVFLKVLVDGLGNSI